MGKGVRVAVALGRREASGRDERRAAYLPTTLRVRLPLRRWRRHGAALAVVSALLFTSMAVQQSTSAAFTASTSTPANYTAGTVVLSDDDAGSALFSFSNSIPGDTQAKCVTVAYSGTVGANVRLYADTAGAAAAYLTLKITRGSFAAAPGGGSCTGFTPDVADYAGKGGGIIYNATLSSFPTDWPGGLVDPSTTTSPEAEGWTAGESHAYKLELTTADDTNGQGTTATTTLTWEAHNTSAASARYAGIVLEDNPVSYWRLGETTGTTAVDQTGRNPGIYQNGTVLGRPGGINGDTDPAAGFDGVNDRVKIPAVGFPEHRIKITLEAWVKYASSTGTGPILEYNTGSGPQVHLWRFPTRDQLYVNLVDSAGGPTRSALPPCSRRAPGTTWPSRTTGRPRGSTWTAPRERRQPSRPSLWAPARTSTSRHDPATTATHSRTSTRPRCTRAR